MKDIINKSLFISFDITRMASSEDIPRKLSPRDIVTYVDTELDQYLEELPTKGRVIGVNVEDLENLPDNSVGWLR